VARLVVALVYIDDAVVACLLLANLERMMAKKRKSKQKIQSRYEICEDGKNRYVVLDKWADRDAPVFETRKEARAYIARQ
jgi:hypothetical protein